MIPRLRTALKRRVRCAVSLSALSCVLLLAVAACASTPTAPAPTPTITATPAQPGVTQLDLPIAGAALPSPDGTMIAGADAYVKPHTVTIYTLDGTVLARASAPQGDVLLDSWLPDSSGLLIWPFDPSSSLPGPLSILSPQGAIQPTGLPSINVVASPDGAWIASLGFTDDSSPSAVEVAPRHGGAVRTLASGVGVMLLGWQGTNVVYAANGNIYAIAPSGGAAHLLTSEGGVDWGPPAGPNRLARRMGRCSFVGERHPSWRLCIGRLTTAGIAPYDAQIPDVLWAGPHQAIGLTGSNDMTVEAEVQLVDLVSGAAEDTGAKTPLFIQALSGEWLGAIATPASGPDRLHFTNLSTKHEVDLGPGACRSWRYLLAWRWPILHPRRGQVVSARSHRAWRRLAGK